MTEYAFKQVDFDKPSFLFKLEDKLKGLFGGFFYMPFIKGFHLKGNERVLDFGCGGGVEARYLLKHLGKEGHLTCVDISSYWIERAKKRLKKYPNAECIKGDIRNMTLHENSFDVIVTVHVIHDIAPEERKDFIHALSKKIKPGGIFFIWEPIKVSHGMPVEEIRELLTRAGFKESSHQQTKSAYKGKFLKIN